MFGCLGLFFKKRKRAGTPELGHAKGGKWKGLSRGGVEETQPHTAKRDFFGNSWYLPPGVSGRGEASRVSGMYVWARCSAKVRRGERWGVARKIKGVHKVWVKGKEYSAEWKK